LYGVANVNILWLVAVSPLIKNNHGLPLDSSISLIKMIFNRNGKQNMNYGEMEQKRNYVICHNNIH